MHESRKVRPGKPGSSLPSKWMWKQVTASVSIYGSQDYKWLSHDLTTRVLLAQQRTSLYPGRGVRFVPQSNSQRIPLKLDKWYKGESTVRYPRMRANIRLITLGVLASGMTWHNNPKQLQNKVAFHLRKEKVNVPRDCMFCCEAIRLPAKVCREAFYTTCSGLHRIVFKAVWGHKEAGKIVKRFMEKYEEHNNTRAQGEEFVAVLYCKDGMHQSVATVEGLRTLMVNTEVGVVVRVQHCNKDKHNQRCQTCSQCGPVKERLDWEWPIVQRAMR